MNANFKKILILSLAVLAMAAIFVFNKKEPEQPLSVDLPLPNEEEYTKQFNDFFKENYSEKVEDSAEEIAEYEALEIFFKSAAKKAIKNIEFYGKIIDQHGAPVSGVTIDYSGSGNILASGSGPGVVQSDANGIFVINDVKANSLKIKKFSQSGYQFSKSDLRRFAHAKEGIKPETTWGNYTKNNPYIIKAWKFERFPKVKIDYRYLLILEPDGRVYTLEITGQKDKFSEGRSQGDIYLTFDRQGDNWQVEMTASDGGFVEVDINDDDFAFLAPENGYVNNLIFSGSDLLARPRKKLYFKSNSSNVYAVIDIRRIIPRSRDGKAVITIKYVINMEGGRSLVTPKRR